MKTYDSVEVAKYLRALAFESDYVLNTTQVQKLLYILYGYYLSTYNHKIINEDPQAWPFGPVFPRTREAINYQKINKLENISNDLQNDSLLTEILRKIVENYGDFPATKLSAWSHSQGGAWDKSVKKWGFKWGHIISDKLIKDYFSELKVFD